MCIIKEVVVSCEVEEKVRATDERERLGYRAGDDGVRVYQT